MPAIKPGAESFNQLRELALIEKGIDVFPSPDCGNTVDSLREALRAGLVQMLRVQVDSHIPGINDGQLTESERGQLMGHGITGMTFVNLPPVISTALENRGLYAPGILLISTPIDANAISTVIQRQSNDKAKENAGSLRPMVLGLSVVNSAEVLSGKTMQKGLMVTWSSPDATHIMTTNNKRLVPDWADQVTGAVANFIGRINKKFATRAITTEESQRMAELARTSGGMPDLSSVLSGTESIPYIFNGFDGVEGIYQAIDILLYQILAQAGMTSQAKAEV